MLHRAAVAGKVFWSGVVDALGADREVDVELALHALERRELVRRERRSSVAGETEYAFRHALLRDVAYGQIPRAQRAELHRRVALWIEALGRAEDMAELRAHHWLNAADYARQAGIEAHDLERHARSALVEAADRALAERSRGSRALLRPGAGALARRRPRPRLLAIRRVTVGVLRARRSTATRSPPCRSVWSPRATRPRRRSRRRR